MRQFFCSGYEPNYSINTRTKQYRIDINRIKTTLNNSDWICFQLSETVFHWLILSLVVELHIMVYGFLVPAILKVQV